MSHTPEKEGLRSQIEHQIPMTLIIRAHKACPCSKPDCSNSKPRVEIFFGCEGVYSTDPLIIKEVVVALERAMQFAWES